MKERGAEEKEGKAKEGKERRSKSEEEWRKEERERKGGKAKEGKERRGKGVYRYEGKEERECKGGKRNEGRRGDKGAMVRCFSGWEVEEWIAQISPRDLCSPADGGVIAVEVSGGHEVPGLGRVVGQGDQGHHRRYILLLILNSIELIHFLKGIVCNTKYI
jgi:hypothetical protein